MAPGGQIALESWTLTPEAIRDWAATAAAGADKVYAQGWHLPAKSETAITARRLAQRGVVTLTTRKLSNGQREYIMQRLRTGRASIGHDPKPKRPKLDGDMARVRRVLRMQAKAGLPCPCNRDLARLAGVRNPSYVLQKLVGARLITNEVIDEASGLRVVTLLDSGEQTAARAVR